MIKKEMALNVTAVVLFLAAGMDCIRGYMHTYSVRYAAEELAGIEPISDSLVVMGAFGISNFLTSFIYFLIIFKARNLVPYVLLLIPFSYIIGGIGLKRVSGVVMESEFKGQYMMAVYLSICLITALLYFISQIKWRKSA